jgi:hypothetical protein
MDDIDSEIEDLLRDEPVMPKKKATKKAAIKKAPRRATKKATSKVTEEPAVKPPIKPAKPSRSKAALYDDRKLTKKGTESLRAKWNAANSANTRNSLMNGLVATARDKFGVDRVFGSREELDRLAIGIPTPSLAFEYMMANDVFPLSSVMMLAGSWGSCKSALSYEIFRWFYEQSGLAVHIDTEDKFDADFACDIMRVPSDVTPIISNRAGSTEQMQELLTYYLKETKRVLTGTKEEPGPKKTVPAVFCIDSLAGATSEEIQEKISKEGKANRTHPINALKNSIYLPGAKKLLEGWPFTLLVVNHMKEKTDDMGRTHQYTLGGQTFNFHESFELRNAVWKQKFKNSQFEGIGIRIQCAKNSFGPTGRRIKTRFLWWLDDDPETGEPRNVYLWDWNWAICTLLNEMEGKEKQRLKDRDIVIKCKSPAADVECLANLPALGMGKDEYLPFQEVGQLIHENEDVCVRIREALNIQKRRILDRPFDDIEREHMENHA